MGKKRHTESTEPSVRDDESSAKYSNHDTLRVDDAHSSHKNHKLSKSERKALRKQKRREQAMRET